MAISGGCLILLSSLCAWVHVGASRKRKEQPREQRQGIVIICFFLYNTVTAAIVESRGNPFVWRRSTDDAPSCLTSSVLCNIQTLTGIGIRWIRGAPDYITQVQDRGFHVYFGDYPLFTKGSFLLSPLSPLMRRTSSPAEISPWHDRNDAPRASLVTKNAS